MKAIESTLEQNNPDHKNVRASHYFWATVLVIFVFLLSLAVIAQLQPVSDDQTTQHDGPSHTSEPTTSSESWLAKKTGEALEKARDRTIAAIDAQLAVVYQPAFQAIPDYANHHYSVLGQYSELWDAARGELISAVSSHLLVGFNKRLENAILVLELMLVSEFRDILEEEMGDASGQDPNFYLPPEAVELATKDVVDRIKKTLPLAAVSATLVGTGSMKLVATAIAKKIATKVAATAALKGVGKLSILAGAGTGAAVCSWSGPGAAVCGVLGAGMAWFATDYIIINIDEYLSRDEFELEIRRILEEDRELKKGLLHTIVFAKALDIGELEIGPLRRHTEDGK